MNTILIPVETSTRELLYKTYLCHLLALKGFKCFLGNKQSISYLLNKKKGYIYLDKGYHVGVSDKIYQTIKRQKGLIVNLDEEGAVDYPDNSTLSRRYAEGLFENSSAIFLWGERQYQLIDKLIKDHSKVKVTGHPRFELLKPEFHELYQSEVNELRNKYGNFILINTNMGSGNNIKGDEFILENYGPRFKNIKQIVEFDKLKLQSYVSLAKKLSKQVNLPIIFRPHPEENIETYARAFTGFPSINVIFEGSAVQWLLAAGLMIHPDCTTGIESLFLGKKPIAYLPENYDASLVTKLPLLASSVFTDEDEVLQFIAEQDYKAESVEIESYEFALHYFSMHKKSSEQITKHITALADNIDSGFNFSLSVKDRMHLNYRALKFSINKEQGARLIKNKLKGLNKHEIVKLHKAMNNINRDFSDVKISMISNGLFKFQAKR